ncbi:L-aminoadipate-semialdehyde dehydrogenase-phosphopantetheinyl transferase [Bactrocera neohumeralis]|uniref:L-aminoadipate-semialdehyde dehydrogenase-phosphopantetheinyl transferase n=1 Tax=Bactrocera tryoni TaxID=59916 RepID=UPI001A9962DF|nr:L-aminoadipate-semialdehyde dehydrogenase-phosphopantetheinyl transferase [Bactrocera tryoni]XP_050333888.1 L-aminoadipate-semialdehyde dehydrogenase-phosphopantetheinyl transferase [Bactrocera neohumeralis]
MQHKCTRWAIDLTSWSLTLPQLAQAVAVIQPEERDRLMKFVFLDDFLSSLVGRLLMRKFVSVHSGVDYKDVRFARDVRGKPYWLQAEDKCHNQLSFNVSHQGKFVVLAGISAESDIKAAATAPTTIATSKVGVGVDVMKIEYSGGKNLAEFFRIMQRKFSDSEWRYIRHPQHNEADQLKAFMRHWCLKEAYVKEIGVGITVDLQKISFTVDITRELDVAASPLTGTKLRRNDLPENDFHFEEHLLEPKYCAAIAFKNCKPVLGKFELVKIEDLLVATEKASDAEIVEYCREVLKKRLKS